MADLQDRYNASQKAAISVEGALKIAEGNYTVQVEETGTYIYVGKAKIGTLTSASVWQIMRVDTASGVVIQWADGVDTFTKEWDERASYTYS